MNVYTLSHIGQFHTNHNEDHFVVAQIGDHQLLIAVMDGCSSGTDSHFASQLIGKLLRKIAKDFYYKAFATGQPEPLNVLLKSVLQNLFNELVNLNNRLDLRKDELLSTVLLGIIDTQDHTAELLAIGDGLLSIDGQITEYEQDNKPDYIAYHLQEDFETWYAQQEQNISVSKFSDLSIATDGLHTFKAFDLEDYPEIGEEEILDLFFNGVEYVGNVNMLKRVRIDLEKRYGVRASDDLTVVRVMGE